MKVLLLSGVVCIYCGVMSLWAYFSHPTERGDEFLALATVVFFVLALGCLGAALCKSVFGW